MKELEELLAEWAIEKIKIETGSDRFEKCSMECCIGYTIP
jgi:hypothetical protein